MTGREDIYRPSAIRALCRITDTGMLQSIERYMKQVILFLYFINIFLRLLLIKIHRFHQLHLFH